VRRLLVGPVITGMLGGGVMDEWREDTEICDGNMSISKLSCTLIIGVSNRFIIWDGRYVGAKTVGDGV
jgi:hypothetical protein